MAVRAGTRNVFTVDLEEWFHVCGVGGELAPEHWDRLPARVEQTTRLLLDLLDALQVRATFFVVGWVADRYPRLIEAVLEAGHEIGSHGYHHTRAYDLGPDAFRRRSSRECPRTCGRGRRRVTMFRAPEWSINDRSLWALEILVEEGITVDASMAPVRLVGAVTYPRHPHVRQTPAGPITEVPPLVVDRFGQTMPLGWGWGLRMSSPRRVLRAIEAVNRAGAPGGADGPSVGARSRTRRESACLRDSSSPTTSGSAASVSGCARCLRAVPFGSIGDMAGALVRYVVIRLIRGTLGPVVLFLVLGAAATASEAQTTATARIAIEDEPPGEAARVMDQAAAVPGFTIPFAARVAFQGAPGDPALAARLAALARRQAPVWLSLPAPAAQEDVEAWRIALHGLLEQHGSALTILELAIDRQPARLARFVAQVAATEVRANHEAIRLALGGPAMGDRGRREDIYSAEMAPYVNLLAIPEGGESVAAWLRQIDPLARIALTAPDRGRR